MGKYEIIEYGDIKSVLSPSEVSPENVYMYLYRLRADVLYVVEKGRLSGVISVGDLLRHYDKNMPLEINRNFRFAKSFDDEEIGEILKEIPSIHELPVVGEKGTFLGVVKAGEKDREEWEWLKSCIDHKRFGSEEEYLYQEFKRWLLKQRAKVIIYDNFSWDVWEKTMSMPKSLFDRRTDQAGKDQVLPLYVLQHLTDEEQKVFFGSDYRENCIQEFMADYEKIELVVENGIYSIKDLNSKYFTFKNGYRVTSNNTGEMHRIYIYGACQLLGGYVSNNGTIEYYLKERLEKEGYPYDVINCGLWKGNSDDLWMNRMIRTDFSEGDIVIIGQRFHGFQLLKEDRELADKYISLEHFGNTYSGIVKDDDLYHFLDCPYHHDSFLNYLDAQKIFKDISMLLKRRTDDYFIPWKVIEYYKKFFAMQGLKPLNNKKSGAIIMTCNPFTKGHKYLIEQASKEVELLYVLVVEEEVPGFSFKDRFQMVCLGTENMDNVKVLPLGKYIVSKETFPQYFDRDNVTEVEKTDYDMHVFADTIGRELGISYRFAGEEPLDKVTRGYNEAMKRVLPKKGITVIEIPRKADEKGNVISATTVRQCIKDGNIKAMYPLLPDTTINYLKCMGVIPKEE